MVDQEITRIARSVIGSPSLSFWLTICAVDFVCFDGDS